MNQNEIAEGLKNELEMLREKGTLSFGQADPFENKWEELEFCLSMLKKELERVNELLGKTQQMISNTENNKLKEEMPQTVDYINQIKKKIEELEKILAEKVMSKTSKEKSQEEIFRDRIKVSNEEPRKITDNDPNDQNPKTPKDRDNDDSPPPLDTILIY